LLGGRLGRSAIELWKLPEKLPFGLCTPHQEGSIVALYNSLNNQGVDFFRTQGALGRFIDEDNPFGFRTVLILVAHGTFSWAFT
jgi:hypothetical protein